MPQNCKNPRVFAILERQTIQKMKKHMDHMGFAIFWHPFFQNLQKHCVFLTFFEKMDAKKLQKPMCFTIFERQTIQKLQ